MRPVLIAALLLAALPLPSWSVTFKDLPPPANIPAELSKGEISKGMARIQPGINNCAAKTQHQGTVTVWLKVNGSGGVDDVKVRTSPDPGLGVCVANAVQKAAFSRSQKGGSFTHSFRF